jgi:hypothetical protein
MSPVHHKPPPLSDKEKEFVRDAIRSANVLPPDLETGEHVNRLLLIRQQLAKDILALSDPSRRSRPWLIAGWSITLSLSTIVMMTGLWRAFVRYDSPIPGIDDPLAFLGWFTAALIVAWLPLLGGWLRARAVRIRVESSEVPDPEPALAVYDVSTVRHLMKSDESAK